MSIETRLEELDARIFRQRKRIATAPDEALDATIARFHRLVAERDYLRRQWRLLHHRDALLRVWRKMKRAAERCFFRMKKIFLEIDSGAERPSRQTAFALFLSPARSAGIQPRSGHGRGFDTRRRG